MSWRLAQITILSHKNECSSLQRRDIRTQVFNIRTWTTRPLMQPSWLLLYKLRKAMLLAQRSGRG